jgi:hypothetical protein
LKFAIFDFSFFTNSLSSYYPSSSFVFFVPFVASFRFPMPTLTIKTPLPHRIVLRDCPFTEYHRLAHFHYRAGSPGLVSKCFGLYYPSTSLLSKSPRLIGIIVYTHPPLNSHTRNIATQGYFLAPHTRSERARLVNRDLRTIARVIIDPQFRSLGLASTLVRQTLPLIGTPYVEASAVMGRFHPFFERADMTRYEPQPDPRKQKLLAAFTAAKIPADLLLDAASLQEKIESLPSPLQEKLYSEIEKLYIIPRQAVFSSKITPTLDWLLPRLIPWLLTTPTYFLWHSTK